MPPLFFFLPNAIFFALAVDHTDTFKDDQNMIFVALKNMIFITNHAYRYR
jgi:hypothetical protein